MPQRTPVSHKYVVLRELKLIRYYNILLLLFTIISNTETAKQMVNIASAKGASRINNNIVRSLNSNVKINHAISYKKTTELSMQFHNKNNGIKQTIS